MSSITIDSFIDFVATGTAWQLLSGGANKLLIAPLVNSLHKLMEANSGINLGMDYFKLDFKDSALVIQSVPGVTVLNVIKDILERLAADYDLLKGTLGEPPSKIHIPVFKDPGSGICEYRSLLDVDETIVVTSREGYFSHWGLQYDLAGERRVFDVKGRRRMKAAYLTTREYWVEWGKK